MSVRVGQSVGPLTAAVFALVFGAALHPQAQAPQGAPAAGAPAQGRQGGTAPTPGAGGGRGRGRGFAPQLPPGRTAAPVDLTGTWVSLITEDWEWRMVTPKKG